MLHERLFLSSSASSGNWYLTFSQPSYNVGLNDIGLDSSKNIFVCGLYDQQNVSGTANSVLIKITPEGSVLWQKELSGGLGNNSHNGLAINSSDDVLLVGSGGSSPTYNDVSLTKYNNSGILQWQKGLVGSTNIDSGNDISVDSAGNFYIGGYTVTQPMQNRDNLLAKYNSAGVVQWQKGALINNNEEWYGVTTDTSGNTYVTGVEGSTHFITMKFNSSGTVLWQNVLYAQSNNWQQGNGVAVDSSGNLYAVGYINEGSGTRPVIVKYDTLGNVVWKRQLNVSSSTVYTKVEIDSDGFIYVVGWNYIINYSGLIVKYNSSGSLQWQRTIDHSSGIRLTSIVLDNTGSMFLSGFNGSNGIVIKLSTDGSGIGSSNGFDYQIGSFSETVSTIANSSYSLTIGNKALTSTTTSLTPSDSLFTPTLFLS